MHKSAQDLYKSILFRAADIYEVDYEDVERDLGQDFDPIVRFMSGAIASELEQVYDHLYDIESRLQRRLASVLLPEHYHLPIPAQSLAYAKPASDPLLLSNRDQFVTDTDGEPFFFTPALPVKILPVKIEIIATNEQVIEAQDKRRSRKVKAQGHPEEVRRIAIGFKAKEHIEDWSSAALYFELKGSEEVNEKAVFYSSMSKAKCSYNGKALKTYPGLPVQEHQLEDYLNNNERLASTIQAKFNHQFLTFKGDILPETQPKSADEFLTPWYEGFREISGEIQEQISTVSEKYDALFWLEIELPKGVEVKNLISRLDIRFNVFPVINRKLNGGGKGEHHYLRTSSIKWISLKPEQDFLAVERVFEEKPPEYPEFIFKPFADFKEDRRASYSIRLGGIGRWDEFNAWKRLAYVVKVLQENFKQKELIEEAASSLSLEDIHHLLGKKISKESQEEKPSRDIYILLHSGISSGIRVKVEYWTSQGESANGISAKTRLSCISSLKSSLEKDSVGLISNVQDGRDPLNSVQQLNAMRNVLLSRGRVVTREDIKVFCKDYLQEKLESVRIKDGVGNDPRFEFGLSRTIDVWLTPSDQAQKEDWAGICTQLQYLMEKNSTSNLPIRVFKED